MTKILTTRELRDFLNSATDASLDAPVQWWGENRGGVVALAEVLKEDYINPSGDGCEPKSTYDQNTALRDGEDVVARAGTLVLHVD